MLAVAPWERGGDVTIGRARIACSSVLLAELKYLLCNIQTTGEGSVPLTSCIFLFISAPFDAAKINILFHKTLNEVVNSADPSFPFS